MYAKLKCKHDGVSNAVHTVWRHEDLLLLRAGDPTACGRPSDEVVHAVCYLARWRLAIDVHCQSCDPWASRGIMLPMACASSDRSECVFARNLELDLKLFEPRIGEIFD